MFVPFFLVEFLLVWYTMLAEAPGSSAITPDIDIRDRFLDFQLIVNIGYQIFVGFYASWKYRSMQGNNILLVVVGSVRSSVCHFYIML